jgi:hypothetical protein
VNFFNLFETVGVFDIPDHKNGGLPLRGQQILVGDDAHNAIVAAAHRQMLDIGAHHGDEGFENMFLQMRGKPGAWT